MGGERKTFASILARKNSESKARTKDNITYLMFSMEMFVIFEKLKKFKLSMSLSAIIYDFVGFSVFFLALPETFSDRKL